MLALPLPRAPAPAAPAHDGFHGQRDARDDGAGAEHGQQNVAGRLGARQRGHVHYVAGRAPEAGLAGADAAGGAAKVHHHGECAGCPGLRSRAAGGWAGPAAPPPQWAACVDSSTGFLLLALLLHELGGRQSEGRAIAAMPALRRRASSSRTRATSCTAPAATRRRSRSTCAPSRTSRPSPSPRPSSCARRARSTSARATSTSRSMGSASCSATRSSQVWMLLGATRGAAAEDPPARSCSQQHLTAAWRVLLLRPV